ncbi:MAG TPA: hypothetical protein VL461_11545 [Dictyobacter sp.]|jgi:hypothetical protein|nr:hypothetical protein [Dictyobacter sp.]
MVKKDTEQTTLPIEDVAVQERQVTIKVLTVGTKQITQSLYKQMVQEDVIDYQTGLLKGHVWGWVNLHDGCAPPSNHLHAIWEDHGQLKRSHTIEDHQKNKVYDKLSRDLATLTYAYIGQATIEGILTERPDDSQFQGDTKLCLSVDDQVVLTSVPSGAYLLWGMDKKYEEKKKVLAEKQALPESELSMYDRQYGLVSLEEEIAGWPAYINQRREELRSDVLKAMKTTVWVGLDEYYTADTLFTWIQERVALLTDIEKNWNESYQAIRDQGQLYIAVSGVWK